MKFVSYKYIRTLGILYCVSGQICFRCQGMVITNHPDNGLRYERWMIKQIVLFRLLSLPMS